MSEKKDNVIPLRPVKSFFVHMLTRDITLKDAILDLLDNCVDGIQRSETKATLKKKKPYEGYWAKINYSKKQFTIEDNCGGIPWKNHEYAFRFGRPEANIDKGLKTVGVYGIGMKRAIFKIGEDCVIETHAIDKSYKVHLSSDWIKKDDEWNLDPTMLKDSTSYGTKISITQILPPISDVFETEQFSDDFRGTVATHFAFIMDKGFQIFVNGKTVTPRSLKLLFEEGRKGEEIIRPFIFNTKVNGVEVFLSVGFTRPIPSSEEAEESLENFKERYSSAEAGWSIICNDRTVLYCDKSAVTGWGVSGVPQYHMQFIAISGIVVFSAEDPSLLPTTTTKRGIDTSSLLYLQVRDKMIEGMKIFTQYTNQWKTKDLVAASKKRLIEVSTFDVDTLKSKAQYIGLKSTHGTLKGQQYKPTLPKPVQLTTTERITFTRTKKDVKKVSEYFDMSNSKPADVGNRCFETILEEASQ